VETDYRRYTYKRALRSHDGWKYIHTMETGESELYDLRNDPSESRNLVAIEPRIAYELEQKLFRHLLSTGQDVYGPWVPGLYPVYASQAPDFVEKK
jgi:arylsulfatase A-like enzyme